MVQILQNEVHLGSVAYVQQKHTKSYKVFKYNSHIYHIS